MPLVPTTLLGPYEILAPIGAGGMGEVYKARDTRLHRIVAIKVLPEHLSSTQMFRERFDREARAVSSMNHPNICALFDVGRQDGTSFLVMEYLEGETLAARMAKGLLPLDQVLRYGIEIAGALDHAHRLGVIHRDLKPANVMITKTGAKVLDFGLAKVQQVSEAPADPTQPTIVETEVGVILGTVQYMPPEQLETNTADARTDIFAFGTVLYEMATGRKAFEGNSRAGLIAAILDQQPAEISTVRRTSPPALDRVVQKCLAKDPEQRWQSARDLQSELQWLAEERPVPTSHQAAPTTKKRRWPLRAAVAAVVMAGVLAGVLAGYRFSSSQGSPQPWQLTRLTTDAGLTDFAALSSDGKLMAYSSDRNQNGSGIYICGRLQGQPILLDS